MSTSVLLLVALPCEIAGPTLDVTFRSEAERSGERGQASSGQEVRNCPRGPGWTSLFLLARALPWDHPWLFPASVAEEGRDRAWERVPDEPEQCVL